MVNCEECGEPTSNDQYYTPEQVKKNGVLCNDCDGREPEIEDEEPGSLFDNPLKFRGWNPLENLW